MLRCKTLKLAKVIDWIKSRKENLVIDEEPTPDGSSADAVRTLVEDAAVAQAFSMGNEWEYVATIFDSGATVTVIPPYVGRAYEVVRSAASKAGVQGWRQIRSRKQRGDSQPRETNDAGDDA